jgi:hypothetical protein
MKKAICLVVMGLTVLGLGLSPAKADLCGFTISNPRTTFDGTSLFQVSVFGGTTGDLYRNTPTFTEATFAAGAWGSANFTLSMTISGVGTSNPTGAGIFTFTDEDSDVLSGNVNGSWGAFGSSGVFNGLLSNVTFVSNDGTFDGNGASSVSMDFDVPQPWFGTFIQVTSSGAWFKRDVSFDKVGGSIDATVTPVPAALLIGLLGLGTAGLKLRKFA